jgi:hypothetical protein
MRAARSWLRRALSADTLEAGTMPESRASSMRERRSAVVRLSAGLLMAFFAVYALSVIATPSDSRWSLHTAMSLVRGEAGDLTAYEPVLARNGYYAIVYCNERPRTLFPVGVSILAMPIVGVISLVNPDFEASLRTRIPAQTEKVIASFYGALAGVLFFWLIFARFRSTLTALGATIIFAFATPMWSTATRALWQHGPLVLMLVAAMLLLIRAREWPALVQYAALPLAFAFVIRPTAAIPIAVISAVVLVCHRRWFLRYLAWAAVIAVPWFVYNHATCGTLLPAYYLPGRLGTTTFDEALLGNLISPARGLFVYSPVLLFALSGFVLALREGSERVRETAFAVIVALHWLAISLFPHWWAGHSYGPRFMTDVVPFLVYFMTFNIRLSAGALARSAVLPAIALLAAVSIVIHAQGALNGAPHLWNVVPSNVDKDLSRLWDWSDPAFIRFR